VPPARHALEEDKLPADPIGGRLHEAANRVEIVARRGPLPSPAGVRARRLALKCVFLDLKRNGNPWAALRLLMTLGCPLVAEFGAVRIAGVSQ
jgi:hypothetical protein